MLKYEKNKKKKNIIMIKKKKGHWYGAGAKFNLFQRPI